MPRSSTGDFSPLQRAFSTGCRRRVFCLPRTLRPSRQYDCNSSVWQRFRSQSRPPVRTTSTQEWSASSARQSRLAPSNVSERRWKNWPRPTSWSFRESLEFCTGRLAGTENSSSRRRSAGEGQSWWCRMLFPEASSDAECQSPSWLCSTFRPHPTSTSTCRPTARHQCPFPAHLCDKERQEMMSVCQFPSWIEE